MSDIFENEYPRDCFIKNEASTLYTIVNLNLTDIRSHNFFYSSYTVYETERKFSFFTLCQYFSYM